MIVYLNCLSLVFASLLIWAPGLMAQSENIPIKNSKRGTWVHEADEDQFEEAEAIALANEKKTDLTKHKNYVNLDSFYDPQTDYAQFFARVTDRDQTGNVLKIQSENLNVRFFKAGDYLLFRVGDQRKGEYCGAYIRGVEDNYFTVFVKDFYPCFDKDGYFKRGTILEIKADVLAKRVRDASLYRLVLLKRRQDYLKQLNDINHFLWSFDQQRSIMASEYDKKMEEVRQQKQRALESILTKKKDQINLQQELIYRLDVLDQDLDFYRIEKSEIFADRWYNDRDLGIPVGERPQELKQKNPETANNKKF